MFGNRRFVRMMAVNFFLVVSVAAAANQADAQTRDPQRLDVSIGQAEVVDLPAVPRTVFVADPNVAAVRVAGARRVLVTGEGVGSTTFFALAGDNDRLLARYTVRVSRDIARITDALRRVAPDQPVRARPLHRGVVLTGPVDTPETARRLVEVVEDLIGDTGRVRNHMTLQAPVQVNLRVRVAEMTRSVAKKLGVNWDGLLQTGDLAAGLLTGRTVVGEAGMFLRDTAPDSFAAVGAGVRGADGSLDGVIDALASENLITVLAEPNLTAMSGEEASFLAGGEFPIPVGSEDGETVIEFREFGVRLEFEPTVRARDRISLRVRTEVSEITDTGSVQTADGIRVPGLRTNRASTRVEMASGQSFAVAGLLRETTEEGLEKMPGIGDLPILGALFRSTQFRRDQTELVILVTPYIVRPSRQDRYLLPQDGYERSTVPERLGGAGLGASDGGSPPDETPSASASLHGSAGFAY